MEAPALPSGTISLKTAHQAAQKQRWRQILNGWQAERWTCSFDYMNVAINSWVRCVATEGGSGMKMVLAVCALVLAASLQPASAQDGWPWSAYPSLRKKVAPKRAQPRP